MLSKLAYDPLAVRADPMHAGVSVVAAIMVVIAMDVQGPDLQATRPPMHVGALVEIVPLHVLCQRSKRTQSAHT
jgi:hypothetical protein